MWLHLFLEVLKHFQKFNKSKRGVTIWQFPLFNNLIKTVRYFHYGYFIYLQDLKLFKRTILKSLSIFYLPMTSQWITFSFQPGTMDPFLWATLVFLTSSTTEICGLIDFGWESCRWLISCFSRFSLPRVSSSWWRISSSINSSSFASDMNSSRKSAKAPIVTKIVNNYCVTFHNISHSIIGFW